MLEEKSRIKKIQKKLQQKELSCVELTQSYLNQIEQKNGVYKCYVKVTKEEAINTAKKVDEKILKGQQLSPLEGVPMSLKDNISTKGIETTCCSLMLKGYKPVFDATVYEKLQQQNSVLLGKVNLDEFAMGCSTDTSCFGGTNNPYDVNYVPGGSSGGSAASVALDLAGFSLGSDTGGSIRQPSSFCGVVGVKPTYGSVSRYGLMALSSSLDQIGPIAASVYDAATVYDVISSKDPKDATCLGNVKGETRHSLEENIAGIKIGVPKQYFENLHPQVEQNINRGISVFERLGAKIVPMEMKDIKYALPIYYILMSAEATSNFSKYDGTKYGYITSQYDDINQMFYKNRQQGFGNDVKRRNLLGSYVLMKQNYKDYYKKAKKIRSLIIKDFAKAFEEVDVILGPTVPTPPFRHDFTPQNQMEEYLSDISTVPVNIAGVCAITMPCGRSEQGLPTGLQLIGNYFCEKQLFNAAYQFEQNCGDLGFVSP